MSGGGNQNSRNNGGRKLVKTTIDDCALLGPTFILHSPNEGVIQKLRVGDQVYVAIEGNASRVITVRTMAGEIAGTLMGANMIQLYNCIQKNYNYIGQVIEKKGGNCKIKVTNNG